VSKIGVFDVVVDGCKKLEVGTVVKVKAVVGEFRGVKQLELKRIYVLRTTGEEVREWNEVARWKRDILSKPWVLTPERLRELDVEEANERRKQRDAEKQRREYKKVKEEKVERYEVKLEKRRRMKEQELKGGALKGTDVLWAPW
jgi:hypothetical protein